MNTMEFKPSTPEWQPPLTPSQPIPPTSTPRTATTTPKSAADRRPKLRASCDACAASKVKCSKEHPICARCKANGSQCIYGVSRKHGKPGRTRKRNPDGTPFIKASKQRPSPDGSEFSKFRIRPEPIISSREATPSSSWSPTPSWPATPEFEFEMTPEPFYLEPSPDFNNYMGDMSAYMPLQPEFEFSQPIRSELTFIDPFARKQSVKLDLPDIQAIRDFVTVDTMQTVNPMHFPEVPFPESMPANNGFLPPSNTVSPHSPRSNPSYSMNPLRVSISMPSQHCCYTLAYSTLESLQIINPENSTNVELKSLDSVLSITKEAVANVLQLLQCPCSSDPHLAMLYSSITSKILTWYQIAAGVKPTTPSTPPSLSGASSPSSSVFSSPLSTPSADNTTFSIAVQPVKIGLFEFDEDMQQTLRRQVVHRELRKCGTLVDALANWGNPQKTTQAEYLYDVLGAWLKTELFNTLREVEGEQML